MATTNQLPKLILSEAASVGSAIWTQIEAALKFYVRGYVTSLADIADGVSRGEITVAEGKIYAKNAAFLLAQGVANMTQVLLHQVQQLINKVLGILKDVINNALAVPLL